jgi:copper chaperone NosL
MTRRVLTGLAFVAALAGAACGARADGPPHIEEDRTACAHCGMLVSERLFAAAYRSRAGEAKVFDDIGCLLNAAKAEPDPASLEFWFHDAATGQWIDGRRAVIVHSASLETPMGGGMVAYGTAEAAAAAVGPHRGRLAGGITDLLKEGAK